MLWTFPRPLRHLLDVSAAELLELGNEKRERKRMARGEQLKVSTRLLKSSLKILDVSFTFAMILNL